jgi:uncharacterized protein (TIGR02266 family)
LDHGREHDRIPYTVEVRFRTTSSFLFSYSVNLSKGGMFIETEELAPIGTPIMLKFTVADHGSYEIAGVVSWHREERDPVSGKPKGMGVEFERIDDTLGEIIDQLVTTFRGLTVLVFCPHAKDRSAVARMVRSIIGTADVVEASGTSTVEALLGDEIDLVIADGDAPDGEGLLVLRATKQRNAKTPTIVLSDEVEQRELALDAGADEVADNPPSFADFQEVLLRALGRPSTIS